MTTDTENKADAAALRRHLHQLTVLLEVSTRVASALEPDQVVATLRESIGELLTYESVAVRLNNIEADATPEAAHSVRRVLRTGQLQLLVPLRAGGRTLGVLDLYLPEPLPEEDVRIVELLASAAAVALHNADLHQELQRLATSDPLTGLSNYRHFHQMLDLEVQRARRMSYPVGLLIADLDFFKAFNDQYGHPAGDEALRRVAYELRSRLRRTDVIGRLGGEEFAVILPGAALPEVATVAEKVRAAIEQLHVTSLATAVVHPMTMSVGGASLPAESVDAEVLVSYADQALYQAKRNGRNQVRLWTGPPLNQ
jgi:diguanylate cyclase (GGDEF)-like protein